MEARDYPPAFWSKNHKSRYRMQYIDHSARSSMLAPAQAAKQDLGQISMGRNRYGRLHSANSLIHQVTLDVSHFACVMNKPQPRIVNRSVRKRDQCVPLADSHDPDFGSIGTDAESLLESALERLQQHNQHTRNAGRDKTPGTPRTTTPRTRDLTAESHSVYHVLCRLRWHEPTRSRRGRQLAAHSNSDTRLTAWAIIL